MNGVFVSDLHGHTDRYEKLFSLLERERPDGVFLGGDLLPSGLIDPASGGDRSPAGASEFIDAVLAAGFARLRDRLGEAYPDVFVILGNDDGRACEPALLRFAHESEGATARRPLWHYVHGSREAWGPYQVFGYAYSPPSPFALKDWERYDVSRFVDPGCSSPEGGYYSVDIPDRVKRTATIKDDLEHLATERAGGKDEELVERAIFLFHAPPYDTALDRADLDDQWVDHVPMDVHVGSIAIRRFIDARHPRITLHGHVHEAPRLTGRWYERLGATHAFTAAHDGLELAVVRFDPAEPERARRELL
jgi:Icc-related predicted phosphoesterase